MGSHNRFHDDSRSYVVVVSHKNPQLRFSNLLENFAGEISDAIRRVTPVWREQELFSNENE